MAPCFWKLEKTLETNYEIDFWTLKCYEFKRGHNVIILLLYFFLFSGVYAVVDLYGQCAQVSITSGSGVLPPDNVLIQGTVDQSVTSPLSTGRGLCDKSTVNHTYLLLWPHNMRKWHLIIADSFFYEQIHLLQ